MSGQPAGNIPLSKINPQYLNANSTSHTWAFSAIAELIDNAYDPDVSAKHIWIDQTTIDSMECLTFTDDGAGLNYDTMLKMMSFGFTDKKTIRGHAPVGQYGNGFKSGSMRLGKDVIVFSQTRDTMSVGLLSQTYLRAIQAEHIFVPIVIFRQDGDKYHEDSLKAILEYSLFKTEEELQRELQAISATSSMGSTGTRIIIWNLRRTKQILEFDFESDCYDIKIPRMDLNNPQELRKNIEPESTYSLRAYCSILYLKPRMQIIIRRKKVHTQLVSKSLAHTRRDRYTPQFLSKRKPIPITFGYDPGNKNSGIMLYYKKRLIKAYERVGCQCRSVPKGVGIIGIIECDFLKPTHNKQDFDDTDEYRKVKRVLGEKLEEYWNEMHHLRQKKDPKCSNAMEDVEKSADQNWVQCDSCQKWRKMPDGIDVSELPEQWHCYQNQDPNYRSCAADEELADSEEDQPYKKTYKLEKKQQREKNRHQTAEDVTSTSSSPATPSPCEGASPCRSDSEPQQEGTCVTPRRRNGSRQNEIPTRATPRSKRQLYPTPGSESAKRAKVVGESTSSSTGTEVVSGSDPLVPQGAPSDLIVGDIQALPIMAQKGNVNQQLSDGALPNEPMETNATPISTSLTSAVTTQANRAAALREQAEKERRTSLGQDQPKSLKQTQRQQEHSDGVHRPLLEMAAEEQNHVQKQLEIATAERDQYRQQLDAAKQERDQCKRQLVVANQERDQNRGQMEAANQERDQYRKRLEAAIQERDQHRTQLEAAKQERDQHKRQLVVANQEKNQSRGQVDAANQERDQYKTQLAVANQGRNLNKVQVEAANKERDQCKMQLEAANQERDQHRTQLEAAKQEIDQYKQQIAVANQVSNRDRGQMEAANKERDQYRLQLEAVKQEGDLSRDQLETVMKERDQCKQQMKAAIEERDQHKCLLEAAIQEKDQYKDQVETAHLERDRYRGQAETANLDRDLYRNQVETANRVKDQYKKQLGATNQEIDRYKGQAEAANLERDQYREQAKTASRERDQFMNQVQTVNQERDQYIANINQLKRALEQMRAGKVRQESCDLVPNGEDNLTMMWDSVLEDLNCCRGEMVQLRSKCEEQRRELEDLRGAGSSIVSPRPAESPGASTSQPGSSESTRLKGLRVTVSRLLPILIPGLDLDQDQVNYENTVIDEILEQYVDGVTYSGTG